MDSLLLDPLLPCLEGDPLDLSLLLEGDTPGDALLGLADWLAALAQRRRAVRRLVCSGEEAGHVLEIARVYAGPPARLTAGAPGRFRLAWRDPDAAVLLARAIAQARVPAGARSVALVSGELGEIQVQMASGEVATLAPGGPGLGAQAPQPEILALVPGQGGMPGGVLVPAGVEVEWVLAFAAYAVRLAVSYEGELPLPLLTTGEGGRSGPFLDQDSDAIRRDPGGRLSLPGGPAGIAALRAMAALPVYPERPIRLQRLGPPAISDTAIYEGTWEVPWEGERLLGALEGLLRQTGTPPGRVELFLSETLAVRRDLAEKAREILRRHGSDAAEIMPRSAYKQAYHWLAEEVLPDLSSVPVADIELRVPRHAAAADELGDACSWVAGLAPADELLQAALGLPAGAVRLALYDEPCYAALARDGTGAVVLERRLTPLLRPMDLGAIYPGKSAAVETGGVRLRAADGRLLAETPVETDTEAAFQAFMAGLSDLRPILEAKTGLPLFGRLEASVTLSEPDEDLPVPWERFSPAEELHEEIYFGTIAALEPLTKARGGGAIRAPGAIVPRVRVEEGLPTRLILRLTAAAEELRPCTPIPLRLREIAWRDGRLLAVPEDEPPDGYGVPAGQLPPGLWLASQPVDGGMAPWPGSPDLTQPYRPEEAWPLTRAAAAGSGAIAWVEGHSYMGREIPAALWCPGVEGLLYSPRRMACHLPTLFVVAGHHANETSSTVSALRLLHGLREAGPGAVVLVVPMENPDGAALHRELATEHPRWKLHAARFNAVGHEFGRDPLDSPFGEALVRPRLTQDFSVDVLVDDHGVPGHEWAQPFSGRSSPPLFPVAYTYPSGVFYGIGQGGPGDDGPGQEILPFWQRVVGALDLDPELKEAQALLWDRYERYGQMLCPDRYPSRRDRGWPFQTARRATRRDAAPWPLEFVTEVADEGASPEQLELCVRAHLHADRSMLAELQGMPGKPSRTKEAGPGQP